MENVKIAQEVKGMKFGKKINTINDLLAVNFKYQFNLYFFEDFLSLKLFKILIEFYLTNTS